MNKQSLNKCCLPKAAILKGKWMVIAFLLIFALIWLINHYYPISIDDWMYSFTFPDRQPIESFGDILKSQYWHYFEWGGRSVGHTIAQTLLWLGEGWGDILNSLAFSVFVFVIYALANKHTGRPQPALPVLIFLLLWFIQRHYLNECVFWFTGSANYLWCSLLMLLFLTPVCSYYLRPADKRNPAVWSVALFLSGIVAGWTNENMSISLIFFLVVLFVLLKYENRKIPVWAKWGFTGLAIGCALLLAAPGNYVRFNSVADQYTPFKLSELQRLIYEFTKFGLLASVIYLLVLGYFIKSKNYSTGEKQALRLSLLFFATAITAWFAMLSSPRFPPRAWFGITSFAIVAISLLYARIDRDKPIIGKLNIIALSLGVALFAVTYAMSLNETIRIRKIFDRRELYIREQRKQGNRDITIRGNFVCNPSSLIFLTR
ncbi:MAG: DUF6056 family protein, partial [Prevotella sp.]|nr:DUF6056 family protein [Prevotella sp.]